MWGRIMIKVTFNASVGGDFDLKHTYGGILFLVLVISDWKLESEICKS
jgi:hypothetical protein